MNPKRFNSLCQPTDGFYLPIGLYRGYCYSTKKGISYRRHQEFSTQEIPITPFIFDIREIRRVDGNLIFNCQLIDVESELTIPLEDVRIKDILIEIRRTERINNPEHFKNAVTMVLNRLIFEVYKREKEGGVDGS